MAESGVRSRLCIFARVPVAGAVKRRLVPALGEAGALAAYTELLEGTLTRCVNPAAYRSELWLAGDADHPQVGGWCRRYPLSLRAQSGADLGERMRRALEDDLSVPTVLIGTDCPDIDRGYLAEAFAALERHELVLGPAVDGGYGLIGLTRPAPELFRDMPWGGPEVLRETLKRAGQAGMSCSCLPEIYDVDRPEDWARYRMLSPGPGRATE
ncbi:MAG: TIGR04282 family arsenosugar biosynthesis glycosyltransferase [Pseudomonadales bacterium]